MPDYITSSGDTWDSISYKLFGPGLYRPASGLMILQNAQYAGHYYIFPQGIPLQTPTNSELAAAKSSKENLPPWHN